MRLAASMAALMVLVLAPAALAPTRAAASTTATWTGANSGYWSDPANWSSDVLPANGEDLMFTTDSAHTFATIDDLPSLMYVNSITFTGSAGTPLGQGFSISPNATTLAIDAPPGTSNVIDSRVGEPGSIDEIYLPLTSTSSNFTVALTTTDANVWFDDAIDYSQALRVTGIAGGNGASFFGTNTFSSATIGTDTYVRSNTPTGLGAGPISVGDGATLAFTLGTLALVQNDISTGNGSAVSAGNALMTGHITLGGSTEFSGGPLTITGVISGANPAIFGSGVTVDGPNTYSGGTTVEGDVTIAGYSGAFGSGSIVVNAGGVKLSGGLTVPNSWTLNSGGVEATSDSNTLSGAVSLGTSAGVGAENGSVLNLSGTISGNSLSINYAPDRPPGGTVQLSGAASNSFAGPVRIWSGTVDAEKTGGATAIGGSSITVDGDLELMGDNELAAGSLSVDGVVRLNGHEQSGITSLIVSGNGSVITDGSGRLVLAGDVEQAGSGLPGDTPTIGTSPINGGILDLGGATRTFSVGSGKMDIAAGIANGGLKIAGYGTLVLSGTNSYTGATTVTGGALEVDGDTAMSDVTAQSGTEVAGNGTVHNLSLSGATLTPGSYLYPAGTVTAANVSLDASSAFLVDLSGIAAGAQYDRLVAGGLVNLGGARLVLTTHLFDPPQDANFTIVKNTGGSPIVATFAGLPEGAHFRTSTWFGWRTFRITYSGGTGHDVVLTALAPDFSGDGFGDLTAVNSTSAWTMTSNGTGFAGPSAWSNTPFYGSRATLAADVDGDGRSDLVAVNAGGVRVRPSTGSAFATATTWSAVPFYGSRATLATDVNGDGRADLIAVNSDSVWVMLSNGSGFNAPQRWSTGAFFGNRSTIAADVNGDGKADLLAVNSGSVYVMTSHGTAFSAPQLWSSTPFYGGVTTLTGDMNGDGKADLIAVNSGSAYVMLSHGTGFSAPQLWSSTPFYGTVATLAGDFNGDGKTDLIAVNASSTYVATSQGTRLATPSRWSSIPFSGNVTVLSGD